MKNYTIHVSNAKYGHHGNGKEEEEEFGSVESFIEEMIDQNSGDFNDVDSWEIE